MPTQLATTKSMTPVKMEDPTTPPSSSIISEIVEMKEVSSDDHTGSETSWSDYGESKAQKTRALNQPNNLERILSDLFSQNVVAKVYRTAIDYINPQTQDPDLASSIPHNFPEIVSQSGTDQGRWSLREPEFWTCGFFPGTLFALLERSIKYPQAMRFTDNGNERILDPRLLRSQLNTASKAWSQPLHSMATRTDTHDIGFIIMPALRREWELFGDERSLQSIIQAAHSLATRYVPSAGAIRSWDCLLKKNLNVTDMQENLLLIIDSMCNLDLLFYASNLTGQDELASIAASHARTMLKTHLRPEVPTFFSHDMYKGQLYSTCHVANVEPASGKLKWRCTAQGYNDDSTWARGQAWGILGYAQTYQWTKDIAFLEAACGLAEYFIQRLETSPKCVELPLEGGSKDTPYPRGRYVPLWDFDAPTDDPIPLRDSSAGVIAANGMLVLYQILSGMNNHDLARRFLDTAIRIVDDTLDVCFSKETASFEGNMRTGEMTVVDDVAGQRFDALLKHGTANNNEHARRRYSDHGLVYGDYYLVEFGNRLLSMGLV